jgi:hypothetical protein
VRRRQAQAGGGAGDQRDLAGEFELSVMISSPWPSASERLAADLRDGGFESVRKGRIKPGLQMGGRSDGGFTLMI